MEYTDVLSKVKPAKFNSAEIAHDVPDPFTRLRASMNRMPLNRSAYVRLLINGSVMMTDAEFERRTNRGLICSAKGKTLIAGLGIGLVLDPLIEKCESVDVVEKNADVIALVAPHFPAAKIHHADIFDWKPEVGAKYDTIYFDIWPHFNGDTDREATRLHRRFRPYLADGGYMESWTRIAGKAAGRRR